MRKGLMALHKFYKDGKLNITPEGYEDIMHLADIIIAKHFYLNSLSEKEELKSVGIVKCLELLNSGQFDLNRASLFKGFLYTGMRNEMRNYIYRNARSFPVEDEILSINIDALNSVTLIQSSEDIVTISVEEILPFVGRNSNDLQGVINSLISMGITVKGGSYKEVEIPSERVAIIQCQVIWKHLEHYQY